MQISWWVDACIHSCTLSYDFIFLGQLGAGEFYGLSEFVLGYDGNGGSSCSLYAASEVVKVI